jgi:ABC-type molybdate transport system substrate-binding protein
MINVGRGSRMRHEAMLNKPAPATRRGAVVRSTLLFLAAAGVLAAAVGMLVWDRPSPQAADVVHLACAAGLRAPVEQVLTRYQKEADGRVLLQYGGSNTLVSQIILSKTGDLVLLADDSYLATLADAGLLAETLPVAEQWAVLCVARGNPRQIGGLADLAGAGVRTVLGSPDQAAIGKVTRTALEQARLWDGIERAVRDRGGFLPTVPEVVNAVKVGAADAAIAWRSNVASEPDLEIVPCPELDTARARVVIAVLTSARSPTAALRLARYLTARDRGLEAFAASGYEVIEGDPWAVRPELTFYCGAVNRRAVEPIIAAFEQREGVRVNTVYNGCGILTGQMRAIADWQKGRGFPDVYMACDRYYLDEVGGLFQEDTNISETEVVIAVPKGNPKGITTIADLTAPGLRLAVGQPKQCTIGVLTRQLLRAQGMLDKVMPNVVAETCSSALLLPMVTTGSVDAAFVYDSDVRLAAGQVDTIRVAVPEAVAVQPLGIARSSDFKWLSRRLMDAVTRGRAAFEAAGFRWRHSPQPATP